MIYKKAYVDIEATYIGEYDIDKDEERDRCFRDFPNWKFCTEREYEGKMVQYRGIIGILTLEFNFDENTDIYKLINKTFIQLIGEEITKERLMMELDGTTEIIGYHCRTKPNKKGYIGYDFGVISGQLGVVLDELIECIDLELLAHGANMYGGLKGVEMQVPSVPPRRSGVANGKEEEKLLHEIAACEDIKKRREMWKKAKQYNREDVVNLVFIEHYLRKLRIAE